MAWNLLVGLDIDASRFADDTWDIPERSVTGSRLHAFFFTP